MSYINDTINNIKEKGIKFAYYKELRWTKKQGIGDPEQFAAKTIAKAAYKGGIYIDPYKFPTIAKEKELIEYKDRTKKAEDAIVIIRNLLKDGYVEEAKEVANRVYGELDI